MCVVKVARQFVNAINDHDVDALAALMTEDHCFIDSMGTTVRGREVMKQGWLQYYTMVPDYQIEVSDIVHTDNMVAMFGKAWGTYTRDGQIKPENRWEVLAAWKAVVDGEQIAHWQVYADLTLVCDIVRRESPNSDG